MLSIYNKLLIFKLYLLPKLLYASPLLAYADKTNFNKLQRAVNKTLRRIHNANMYMRNSSIRKDLNIPTLGSIISKGATNFYVNLNNLDYKIIAGLPTTT